MMLEMYLDGNLIDSVVLLPGDVHSEKNMQNHIKALEAKHKDLISKSGSEPSFLLSGVNSSMNSFVPLMRSKD